MAELYRRVLAGQQNTERKRADGAYARGVRQSVAWH